jgi:acyl carrier protein
MGSGLISAITLMSYENVAQGNQPRPHFTEDELLAGIAAVARAHLAWTGAVTRDLPLVETFSLDSLRQLTLVIELENRFRVKLDDLDEEALVTVGDVVDVIRRKLA